MHSILRFMNCRKSRRRYRMHYFKFKILTALPGPLAGFRRVGERQKGQIREEWKGWGNRDGEKWAMVRERNNNAQLG